MQKLKDRKGNISVVEIFIIFLLCLEALYLLYKGGSWLAQEATGGNDRFLENTAESTAVVESLNGLQCPVYGCSDQTFCTHQQGEWYVGYFDEKTHHIIAYAPKGYNQNKVMRIGNKKYYGDPGTMVIMIRCRNGEIELSWVKGRNS